MYFVDRSLAVIKPKQPLHDWLKSVPGNDLDISLEALRADGTAFLLPEFDEPEQAVGYIDEIYESLFEMELASWYDDTALWPASRSLKDFWEWFDVEIHTTVIDSVDEDITNSRTSLL